MPIDVKIQDGSGSGKKGLHAAPKSLGHTHRIRDEIQLYRARVLGQPDTVPSEQGFALLELGEQAWRVKGSYHQREFPMHGRGREEASQRGRH